MSEVKLSRHTLELARLACDPGDVTHAATIKLLERAYAINVERAEVHDRCQAALGAGDVEQAEQLLAIYRVLTAELTEVRERHQAVIRGAALGSQVRN